MADFNLPGISSSNIDIKGIIDKLVKVESKKLDRFESAKEKLNKEKTSWITLSNKIDNLQEVSEALYGFRSPFEDKIALSSDEDILAATASRIAQPSKSTVMVEQIAKNERILSDPVNSRRIFKNIPLKINIGEEELEVYFKGGNIDTLAEEINKQAGKHLNAKITKDTRETSVLILEAKETGEKNRILLRDEATINFFKGIGLFEEKAGLEVDTELKPERIFPLEGSLEYKVYDNILTLEPENSTAFILDKTITSGPNLYFKVKIRVIEIEKEELKEILVKWPELKNIGKVTVKDIDIQGGKPVSKLEEPEVKEEPRVVIDNTVIGLGSDREMRKTRELKELDESFREYTFKFTDIVPEGEKVDRILFFNKNTGRKVEYTDLVIEDISVRRGISPKHLIQEGKDAVVYIDGVRVQRDSNEFDDAVKGVKLELRGESNEEVSLTIDRDYEKITQKIIDIIEKYNELLEYINEQTKIAFTGNLDDKNEVGILSGDITVMGLKSKLQKIMMNPYPTDRGRECSLLVQIGISMGASGSSWEDIKGGCLQVDEDKFVEAFEKYPDTIKQLFGSDTNNDVIIDNGAAYVMDKTLKAYTNPRVGIIPYRIGTTETGIKDQENRIDDWKVHLEEYRKKLESDFMLMQHALNELERNQKSLENFSTQFRK